jgi:hypothetical protein
MTAAAAARRVRRTTGPGTLVISLDFELAWGVPGGHVPAQYRKNLEGVRAGIAGMLDLFEAYRIHATWAAVGLLFFDDRETLFRTLPRERPAYTNSALSPYPYVERELGTGESDDPLHFAPSVIRSIQAVPFQEIGTHTFSHYYCLEPGQDASAFTADLRAARAAAALLGIDVQSLVFPRNQVNAEYLSICARAGITAYRGACASWAHAPRSHQAESRVHRASRLLDSYVPLSGDHSYASLPRESLPVNVPASRFLRPFTPAMRHLEPLRLRRITGELRTAASRGALYHLWWHPHNFGTYLHENLAMLRAILEEYRRLATDHGMTSRNMGEVAASRTILADSVRDHALPEIAGGAA